MEQVLLREVGKMYVWIGMVNKMPKVHGIYKE